MNPAKCTAEDYINFVIATPRVVTATEAERVQPISENAPAHDAFTRLLTRLEPNAETLWEEAKTQIDLSGGINLITLLWTDGVRCVPVDYRIFDKDTDGKTKNDHFSEMLMTAFERGFNPQLVCFDSWYGSIDNLKLCRALGWHFLTRESRKKWGRFFVQKVSFNNFA